MPISPTTLNQAPSERFLQPNPHAIRLANGVWADFHPVFAGMISAIGFGSACFRSPSRPIIAQIQTPDGVELVHPRALSVKESPEETLLTYGFSRREGGLMEWMLHSVRNRISTADWSREPEPIDPADTRLELVLRPVERRVGDWIGVGFSYQYRYYSRSLAIYRIRDCATWEPGGSAIGSELWVRCPFTSSIRAFTRREDAHSTEWYLPEARNPNIFQFMPFHTAYQGFTMTAGDEGVLVTSATQPAHIRTLVEKRHGDDVIVHWHEHCGDLAREMTTSPMEVLWFPPMSTRVERANLYEAMRDHVSKTIHAAAGLREERVTTYGVMEEWMVPNLRRYGDVGVKKLADAGVKTVMIPSQFANNMNEYGVSNMCCTTDWRVPESVGEENLTYLCTKAREVGIAVEMWGNTALSTLEYQARMRSGQPNRLRFPDDNGSIWPELAKANDPWVRNPTGAIEADHYAPVFACLNLRDQTVQRLWNEKWKYAHDVIGLRGIFLDSSFNLTSDKFHYNSNGDHRINGATADQTHLHGRSRPLPDQEPSGEILTQFHAHLQLVRDMQQMGYRYSGEDNGMIGVNRGGPSCVRAADQLHLWGNAIIGFDAPALKAAGHDADDVFFRALSYRVMWFLYWQIGADRLSWRHDANQTTEVDLPTPWQISLLHAFSDCEAHMHQRTILPGEHGVVYRGLNNSVQVLWAFNDLKLDVPAGSKVRDVTEGTTTTLANGQLSGKRHHVYMISPA